MTITTLTAAEMDADITQLGLKGSPTWVVKVFAPQMKGERTMIEGTVQEQVDQLAEKLMEWC